MTSSETEKYVKDKWDRPQLHIYFPAGGFPMLYDFPEIYEGPVDGFPSNIHDIWQAAYNFTRQREEEIRLKKFDVEHVKKYRDAVGRYCHEHPCTTQTLEKEIPNLQSWTRILSILESQLTELQKGIKENNVSQD